MKIYTRTGDQGQTALFSGDRVLKCDEFIESYGDVDELNSFVGLARAIVKESPLQESLNQIQHDLHALCADLANPLRSKKSSKRMAAKSAQRLEKEIDEYSKALPELRNFILPGGSELACRFHICRTVCRRAERRLVRLSQVETINPEALIYLNRLSDLFFVLSRQANLMAGIGDTLWDRKFE
ncbi:MAG: ATP:cob(I)alamin adenosyltransferase [Deltaproteobacteria bacterium CG11_big_fil_rev_8_21_14_0_20_45_16]|nr:MAG: ATP:cob(I)alamin adenosyltransferase [Deltaproteobacteria bacterium CG11_big_fil_rev_8_21_14_0_20_45_16]